jgi:hypothetical protein
MPGNVAEELSALTGMKPPELRAKWRDVYRAVAPDIGPDLLQRGIAYRLQERRQGSLASSIRRDVERLIKQLGKGQGELARSPASLKTGTRLVRSWRGKMHHVLILDEGYEYDGRRYQSLTQIAQDITGAHWSGPRFFGLVTRRSRTLTNRGGEA